MRGPEVPILTKSVMGTSACGVFHTIPAFFVNKQGAPRLPNLLCLPRRHQSRLDYSLATLISNFVYQKPRGSVSCYLLWGHGRREVVRNIVLLE